MAAGEPDPPCLHCGANADAELHLPAEALLRLLAGRLDPDHTPASVSTKGIELDELRAVFPGY